MARIQNSLSVLLAEVGTLSTNQKVGHVKLRLDLELVNKRLSKLEALVVPEPLTNFKVFPIKDEKKMKSYSEEITKNGDFVSYLVILFLKFEWHKNTLIKTPFISEERIFKVGQIVHIGKGQNLAEIFWGRRTESV